MITKRITRLEEQVGTELIVRSTRGLTLTAAGEQLIPRFMRLVAELEETIRGSTATSRGIEGHLRIKAPTTGDVSVSRQSVQRLPGAQSRGEPRYRVDGSIGQPAGGRDSISVVGARPVSYPGVVDVPLCAYPQALCCAPTYMHGKREPEHPSELTDHNCLTSVLLGNTWLFDSPRGPLSVEVHSRFHVNDGRVLREATRQGLGIAAATSLPRRGRS